MIRRIENEYLAGYALSGLSPASRAPPAELGTRTWKEAYLLFFARMGAGRTPETFCNSLKNIRDAFDTHVAGSPRTGWQDPSNLRAADSADSMIGRILRQYRDMPGDELSERMLTLIRGSDPVSIEGFARTEGGLRVRLLRTAERDARLRAEAIRIHGTACHGCGFCFASAYGPWGEGHIEVHHMTPLGTGGERKTNPATDLLPLCANCHRMVHRRPGIGLSVTELRELMAPAGKGSLLPVPQTGNPTDATTASVSSPLTGRTNTDALSP